MTETYFAKLSRASPGVQLQHLIAGYWVSQAIAVAGQLGVADLLVGGPKPTAELAEATGTHPRALYRLLRALAGVGVFTEVEPGTFGLAPMAELLRSDAPASLRGMAVYLCGEEHWRAWGHLGYSVRTGQSAFEHLFGVDPWEYRAQHPETNAAFNAFMTGLVTQVADAVAEAHDFSGSRTVVDVGGATARCSSRSCAPTPGCAGCCSTCRTWRRGRRSRSRRRACWTAVRSSAGTCSKACPKAGTPTSSRG